MWQPVKAVTEDAAAAVAVLVAEVTFGDAVPPELPDSWSWSSCDSPSATTSTSSPVESKQNLTRVLALLI